MPAHVFHRPSCFMWFRYLHHTTNRYQMETFDQTRNNRILLIVYATLTVTAFFTHTIPHPTPRRRSNPWNSRSSLRSESRHLLATMSQPRTKPHRSDTKTKQRRSTFLQKQPNVTFLVIRTFISGTTADLPERGEIGRFIHWDSVGYR